MPIKIMSMAISFGRVEWGVPFNKVTKSFDHVVLQGHIKCFSCCITTTTTTTPRPMVTKLGKVVTYYKKLQPIKSHKPLNAWSHMVK